MESYKLIAPPCSLEFTKLSKETLAVYGKWFFQTMPTRRAELERAVRVWDDSWSADLSIHSLSLLSTWFDTHIASRKKTADEIDAIKSGLRFEVPISDVTLTSTSFSITMDVAMYFGQVAVQNIPGTRWEQQFRSRKEPNYGEPSVVGSGPVPANPVRLLMTRAYALIAGETPKHDLVELFYIRQKRLVLTDAK